MKICVLSACDVMRLRNEQDGTSGIRMAIDMGFGMSKMRICYKIVSILRSDPH